jgi:hypothetical protein
MKDTMSFTPAPQFTEPTVTVPAVLRTSRRHPETGVLCFSEEEWEAENLKFKNQLKKEGEE